MSSTLGERLAVERAYVEGLKNGRAACAELVRAMAAIEREVGESWEKEAREKAPLADVQHLRNCAAIGYAYKQFAERLDDLVAAIESRGAA